MLSWFWFFSRLHRWRRRISSATAIATAACAGCVSTPAGTPVGRRILSSVSTSSLTAILCSAVLAPRESCTAGGVALVASGRLIGAAARNVSLVVVIAVLPCVQLYAGQVSIRLMEGRKDVTDPSIANSVVRFLKHGGSSVSCRVGTECGLEPGTYDVRLEDPRYVLAAYEPRFISDTPAQVPGKRIALPVKRVAFLDVPQDRFAAGEELQVLDVESGIPYFFVAPRGSVRVPASRLLMLLKGANKEIMELSRPFTLGPGAAYRLEPSRPRAGRSRLFVGVRFSNRDEFREVGSLSATLRGPGTESAPELTVLSHPLRVYFFWFETPQIVCEVLVTARSGVRASYAVDLRGRSFLSLPDMPFPGRSRSQAPSATQ